MTARIKMIRLLHWINTINKDLKVMNLYVVRHGETDMGKNHIIANETEPLNANGIRQAQNLHNELEKLRIDRIYVSPIQRAKDTLFYFHLSKDIPVENERMDHSEWSYVNNFSFHFCSLLRKIYYVMSKNT